MTYFIYICVERIQCLEQKKKNQKYIFKSEDKEWIRLKMENVVDQGFFEKIDHEILRKNNIYKTK